MMMASPTETMKSCDLSAPDNMSSATLQCMDTLIGQLRSRADSLIGTSSEQTTSKFQPNTDQYNSAALLYTFILAASTLVVDDNDDGVSRPTSSTSGADIYERESALNALGNLLQNSHIRRSDPPVSLPTDIQIPLALLKTTGLSSQSLASTNAFNFSRHFIKTLLRSIKPHRAHSRSTSTSRSATRSFSVKHDVLKPQQRDSLGHLLSDLLVTYGSSEGSPTMLTDSPCSEHSAVIYDDSNSSLTDSPLTTPVSSSEDLPTVAIVARSNTKSAPHLHEFPQCPRSDEDDDESHPHTHSFNERNSLRRSSGVGKVLTATSAIGPSNSGSSSSASSFTRVSSTSHSTGRTRARTRTNSILSLCSASIRSASPQRSRRDKVGDFADGGKPTLIKSMSVASITPSEKSSMGSFTPVTAKTAAGSLKLMISTSMRPGATWPEIGGAEGGRGRRPIFHMFGEDDDKSEPEDAESDDNEGLLSDDEDDADLDADNRHGRLSIKRAMSIPSVSLTQASFSPPSPISEMNGPNSPLLNPANRVTSKIKVHSSLRQLAHEQRHQRRSSTVPPGSSSQNKHQRSRTGGPPAAQREFVSSPLSPNRNPSSKFKAYIPVSTNPPSPSGSDSPFCYDPELTLPMPPLDPTLAALEKKCKLKLKVSCSNCGVVGWDFSRGRSGEAFCSRDCRLAVKERTKLGLTLAI